MKRLTSSCCLILLALLLAGCGSLSRIASVKVVQGVEETVAPVNLRLADVDIACSYAHTGLPLLDASRSFGADPSLVDALLLMTAGACADARALEEELRYLRAFRSRRTEEAEDARSSQKRWAAVATQRQLAAHTRMRSSFERQVGYSYGRGCPRFRRDFDEFAYLIGSIAGAQAVLNAAVAQTAGASLLEIPPRVEAAMACLDNAKWWGAPQALRATVLSLMPGGAQRPDLKAAFSAGMSQGERSGVRLAHVMAAIGAAAADNTDELRAVIKRFAATPGLAPDPAYRLVDAIAESYVLGHSDRLWTQATGSRTPTASFGRFWNDPAIDGPKMDVDAILK